MEIAVADMADDWGHETTRIRILSRFRQAFGKPRHRHADVGDHGAGAGPQAQAGVERVIAGMPEPAALLGAFAHSKPRPP